MKHRIRVCAIVFNDKNELLLIKADTPESQYSWWSLPGGGVEREDDNLFQTAERETFEETGITIKTHNRIQYISEYYEGDRALFHIQIFVKADYISGTPHNRNLIGKGGDEKAIKKAAWISRQKTAELIVFPEFIHTDEFWHSTKDGIEYKGKSSGYYFHHTVLKEELK